MKRSAARSIKVFAAVIIVVAAILASGYSITKKTSAHTRTQSSDEKEATTISSAADKAQEAAAKATFISSVQNAISNYSSADIGVSMIDLDTNTQTDVGETAAYTAASTTKVLTAVLYMHRVEQGSATLDTVIDGSSAQTLLQKMINLSDNTAWADLNDYLGKPQLQAYAANLGLTSYDPYENTITPHDEAQLLAKLYDGELITQTHAKLLYSFMQHTSNEDLIPAALPSDATVYHKYGYLGGELHDAAIITYKGHHIALTIYTKGTDLSDYDARTAVFHTITNAATTYMETK
jgi:beta-lactamase class A